MKQDRQAHINKVRFVSYPTRTLQNVPCLHKHQYISRLALRTQTYIHLCSHLAYTQKHNLHAHHFSGLHLLGEIGRVADSTVRHSLWSASFLVCSCCFAVGFFFCESTSELLVFSVRCNNLLFT